MSNVLLARASCSAYKVWCYMIVLERCCAIRGCVGWFRCPRAFDLSEASSTREWAVGAVCHADRARGLGLVAAGQVGSWVESVSETGHCDFNLCRCRQR
jgi:hypothetical protein